MGSQGKCMWKRDSGEISELVQSGGVRGKREDRKGKQGGKRGEKKI